MTWLVGTNTLFGHAVIASDICVTFTANSGEITYIDCLQKVYPLGKFVIGAWGRAVATTWYDLKSPSKQGSKIVLNAPFWG